MKAFPLSNARCLPGIRPGMRIFFTVALALCLAGKVRAADSICATVRIHIAQELTFERQAFEATLSISNGLPAGNIENLSVALQFLDKDKLPVEATTSPANTEAVFFYRPDGPAHPISVTNGTKQELKWLIIPSTNSAGNLVEGKVYFIGATVQYTAGGVEQRLVLEPDQITVRPTPKLKLDYFLPGDVLGDDPATVLQFEPPSPFVMGVRISNTGFGLAQSLKIESGQPKIVRNDSGLLVNFAILGCEVQGKPATPSLLADFGEVPSLHRAVAIWTMASSLSGSFTEFIAYYTHADELGGEVTSLLQQPSTHKLIHEIQVDLPGRDGIADFLATDFDVGEDLKVFESDSGTEDVLVPVSARYENETLSGLTPGFYQLSLGDVPAGKFLHAKAADPFGGTKVVQKIQRSDGKVLSPKNYWLSKSKVAGDWNYYVHVFDANATASNRSYNYLLEFVSPSSLNRAPLLGALADRVVQVGKPLSILIRATDPDGGIPAIVAVPRPLGAVFQDNLNGTALLAWTPTTAQVGTFPLKVTASDGKLSDEKTVLLTVTQDEQFEEWKKKYFGDETDPNIVGNLADPDGDGLQNLYEYGLGLDPTKSSIHLKPKIGKVESNGKHYLTFTYNRITDDENLSFDVLGSSSLRTESPAWAVQPEDEDVDQSGVADGMLRVRVTDTVALEDSPSGRFLKLKISLE